MLLRETPRDLLLRPLTRNQALGCCSAYPSSERSPTSVSSGHVMLWTHRGRKDSARRKRFPSAAFGSASITAVVCSNLPVYSTISPVKSCFEVYKAKAQRLMKKIGVKGLILTEHEMNIAAHLVNPRDIKVTWNDIAGLDDVIAELQNTVILPFQKRHLFRHSKLCQPPKGVLLHGPPGCGKTLLAKAIARASGCQFINLQPAALTDKWYGESQKLTASVFSLATKLQPCIIFIDEIDSFLRSRSSLDHEATAMMKAQFMSLWDGLDTLPDSQVMILGASNRPQDVDSAILRRMPVTFQICQPTQQQRQEILKLILTGENMSHVVNLKELAQRTAGYSGSDLHELCRDAAMYRVRDYVRKQQMLLVMRPLQGANDTVDKPTDRLRPITQLDLLLALDKMNESKGATAAAALQQRALD